MAAGTDRDSTSDGPLDAQAVLRQEFAHVLGDPRWAEPLPPPPLALLFKELHAQPADRRPSALCLSGGGIRSATFCLGVLQWLAEKQQLQSFHYLSTVSGGGYIGSWLVNGLWQAGWPFIKDAEAKGSAGIRAAQDKRAQAAEAAARDPSFANVAAVATADAALAQATSDAKTLQDAAAKVAAAATVNWLHRVGQSSGCVGAASAAGAARTGVDGPDPVAPLRGFSNYLSPTGGLSGDAFSLAAIFVRNLLLNALVWLPLLAAIVAGPRLYIALLESALQAKSVSFLLWPIVVTALLAIVWGVAYVVADLPEQGDEVPVPTAPNAAARQAAAPSATGSPSPNNRFYSSCFLPIVVASIVLSVGGAWIATLRELSLWWFALAGAVAHLAGVAFGVPLRMKRGLRKRRSNVWGVIVVVAVGAVGGMLATVALSQLAANPATGDTTGNQRLLYATFAVPAMTGAFWLAMALYAGLMGRFTDEQDREWWARATGAWLKFSVLWVSAFALVVWLPLPILDRLGATGPTALQFGVGGGVLGVVTSLIGYWSKNGADLKRKARSFLRVTRLKLLDAMAALVVVTTLLALSLSWNAALDRCHGWTWTARLCTTDLHAQTDYLREQTRLRVEYDSATKRDSVGAAAAAAALATLGDGGAEPGLSASAQVYRHTLLEADGWMIFVGIVALLGFSAGLALAMGVNVFSLHGMYGNRLVRAYLGSGRAQRRPHWFTGFDPDDNPKLHLLAAPLRGADGHPRLYPVINIALNIVRPSPKHLDWQQRKAAAFIATPLHCGAAPVDYRPTESYADGMSLGRALTISGAAASPNMGYHSSALVTFVMTLFNVRLGWWSPNPNRPGERWKKEHPWIGLDVAWAEATGNTGVDDPFVYLSDGGHFDNLGIYEMVRRRCHRIVAIDATCDGEFKWTNLLEVVRKVRVDFGIPIELPAVLPGQKGEAAQSRCIEARIRYSARDDNDEDQDGTLIVLKPRLMPQQDPPELAAYAAASAADGSSPDDPARFPHQSTADQFFNEQQFESYRLLGYLTAADTLDGKSPLAATAARKLGRRAATTVVPAGSAVMGSAPGAGQARQDAAGTSANVAGAAGVGHLIHQMGSGAALATALTIGGTLGVAGTVALAPTELRLSDVDRALLKGGMPLRVDASELKLNDADRTLLGTGIRVTADGSGLNEPAKQLNDAATSLEKAAKDFSKLTFPKPDATTVVLDPALRPAIDGLKDEISQLSIRIRTRASSGAAPADVADLTSALTDLHRTLVSIEKKLPTDPALAQALKDLKEAVENIAPRRNVRGQDGGTR